jgi:ribosomal protein S18 acetylase RimI-like enzyme
MIQWSDNIKKPLIIHRLAVDIKWQNKGIGRKMMDFAIEFAEKKGFGSIRFDVYSGNPGLITTYDKMGCIKKGEVIFPHRDLPFYCYELNL